MGRLVIEHARVLDATGRDPIDDGVLIAEDGVVRYVGSRDEAPSVPEAEVFDADGRTLIPGLVDCHVHLTCDAWEDFENSLRAQTVEEAVEVAVRTAGDALRAGITTVRDLGGKADSVMQAARRLAVGRGPRIVAAGTWLTKPGGHVSYAGREIDGPEDAADAVREQFEAGARVIKVVATGGVLSSGMSATEPALDDATLRAIVGTARSLGMRVAAHAIGAGGITAALRAGVDSIEHGNEAGLVDRSLFFERPAWLVPTFSAPDGICRCLGIPEYARKKAEDIIPRSIESFQAAIADGVRVACGSDAGTPDNPVGAIARELELLGQHGLPPMRVLQSATSEAAALLGFGDLGTLEAGKQADCVLLDGDPLTDPSAYAAVSAVFAAGSLVAEEGKLLAPESNPAP